MAGCNRYVKAPESRAVCGSRINPVYRSVTSPVIFVGASALALDTRNALETVLLTESHLKGTGGVTTAGLCPFAASAGLAGVRGIHV